MKDDPFAPLPGFAYDLDGRPRYGIRGDLYGGSRVAAPQSSVLRAAEDAERIMAAKHMAAQRADHGGKKNVAPTPLQNLHVSRTDTVMLCGIFALFVAGF